MKISLTLSDLSATAVARILAAAEGTGATVSAPVAQPAPAPVAQPAPAPVAQPAPAPVAQPQPAPAPVDDDENGPTNENAPATDADGLPWDERIHAKTKKTNADGTWRKKRGVADDIVSQVEAELKAANPPAQSTPATANVPMPAEVAQPQPAPAPVMPANLPPMPSAQPQPAPAPVAAPAAEFMDFMNKLRVPMQTETAPGQYLVDQPYLQSLTQRVGDAYGDPFPNITGLQTRLHMIPYALQLLQADGKI